MDNLRLAIHSPSRIFRRSVGLIWGIIQRRYFACSPLKWTDCLGIGGRFGSEWVDDFDRNQWPVWIGTGGRNGSEYATYLGHLSGWYQAGQSAGFIGAIIGAILILSIYRLIKRKQA
jgi:hypothetical protein